MSSRESIHRKADTFHQELLLCLQHLVQKTRLIFEDDQNKMRPRLSLQLAHDDASFCQSFIRLIELGGALRSTSRHMFKLFLLKDMECPPITFVFQELESVANSISDIVLAVRGEVSSESEVHALIDAHQRVLSRLKFACRILDSVRNKERLEQEVHQEITANFGHSFDASFPYRIADAVSGDTLLSQTEFSRRFLGNSNAIASLKSQQKKGAMASGSEVIRFPASQGGGIPVNDLLLYVEACGAYPDQTSRIRQQLGMDELT